tara:strand:- start:161 stop:778 length:618 start_codon:yes stop_codon:yes gene_type:complete
VRNKSNIFKPLVILILMISPVFSQSAEEILEIALERSLALNNSYYKFIIESEVESPLLPMTGELYTKGEKYFIDTKDIDQIYDGKNIFTIVHENQEIIVDNSEISLITFTPNRIFNFFLDDYLLNVKSETKRHIIEAKNKNEDNMIYSITINSSNYSIEKIEMKDSISDEIINTFLTLTYDNNLTVPLSLFKFDINNYDNYILVQ